MNVRDDAVTLCTIDMLPASRFESCARNNVGRSAVGRISLASNSVSVVELMVSRILESTAVSRSPLPAATIRFVFDKSTGSCASPLSASAKPDA
jgi:hypothetical protein